MHRGHTVRLETVRHSDTEGGREKGGKGEREKKSKTQREKHRTGGEKSHTQTQNTAVIIRLENKNHLDKTM